VTATCAQLEELAPELALGLLSGAERADALRHLAACPGCRAKVEDLARLADRLLLVAPEAEPPVGFEARVLDRLERAARTPKAARPWWRRPLVPVVVAGAAALALVAGVVVGRVTERDPLLEREYVAALRTLGGSSLRAARLLGPGGEDAGEAFLYQGRPSWVFVDVRDPSGSGGAYWVELDAADGKPVAAERFALGDGSGSVGWTVRADVSRVASVVVRGASGAKRYSAQLPRSS